MTRPTTQEAAADLFIDRLDERVHATVKGKSDAKPIEPAIAELRDALGADADLDEVVTGTFELISTAERMNKIGGPAAALGLRHNVGKVRAALDVVLAGSDDKDLHAAEAALIDCQSTHAGLLADLDAAIAARDIPAVMRLRADVEVQSPRAIAEATLRVMDLKITAVESRRDAPVRRSELAHKKLAQARSAVEEAQSALDGARRALENAQVVDGREERAANMATRGLEQLRSEREFVEHSAASNEAIAIRRLAGLPSESATDAGDEMQRMAS